MTNDQTQPQAGDDAFGWPGQNQQADADQGGMGQSRPTSPATGAARAAAARAAYEDVTKTAPQTEMSTEAPTGEETPVEEEAAEADPPLISEPVVETAETAGEPTAGGAMSSDAQLAAERLADYQRLNAEYVNYKRRVDRERAEDRTRTMASFVESLLPVLDEIHLAREHGELAEGSPFAKISAKLEGILAKHGVESFGEVGEAFDPTVHEALMHTTADLPPGTTETTVVMVMQPGFRIGDRVVRPARVSVADPA